MKYLKGTPSMESIKRESGWGAIVILTSIIITLIIFFAADGLGSIDKIEQNTTSSAKNTELIVTLANLQLAYIENIIDQEIAKKANIEDFVEDSLIKGEKTDKSFIRIPRPKKGYKWAVIEEKGLFYLRQEEKR